MMKRNITGLDIVGALSRSGFEDIASNILNMLRQRVTGDYLQTSAILDRQFDVVSAVNDINDYQGPGTGYRISAERWAEIKNIARRGSARLDRMGGTQWNAQLNVSRFHLTGERRRGG